MDTKIFVMTHKKIEPIADPMYIPLHVGKAGKEDLGYLGDDTGDNISDRNRSYCELTGIYWLWKNMSCDIIGICHYRRYFIREERLLNQAQVEETIQKYPIIVPDSTYVMAKEQIGSIQEHYDECHNLRDMAVCREVLQQKYPEYVLAFDYSMKITLFTRGNMWITRKEIFDRYCEWLFDILFEVEARINITKYDDYQKRVMGFLSERLFRVWLFMQPESILEEKIKQIEPHQFYNAEKKIELLYQCISLKIKPVIEWYKKGLMTESMAELKDCGDDFDGKIPVWVCWWQGEENMPELINLCVNSLKQNIPEEKTALRFITLDNCMQYVTFSEAVIAKFNEGKISLTHLSDIIRAELLYRYGGMWIDATYYVPGKIPDEIFERESLFTIKLRKPVWSADITASRYTANLCCVPKGHKLFQFVMESLWYYWETEDEIMDYFLIDYIIAAALEELPDIRAEWEQCAYFEGEVFALQNKVNKLYIPERWQRLKTDSIFYKLNRRRDYRKENIVGKQTIYGYLVEQMEDAGKVSVQKADK